MQANHRYQLVLMWMAAFMAVAYLLLGAAILFSLDKLAALPMGQKLPLGIMFICYGLFRAYRFVKKYLLIEREEDEA